MKFFLQFGHLLVLFLILLLAIISLNELGYLDKWKTSDIEVPFITSDVDYDSDGIDDYTDILNGARSFIAMNPKYKSAYYAEGYPDDGYYVCSDLIWYALSEAGYDFKEMIDEDIKNNQSDYDIDVIDSNIDFRRVRNIRVFLEKYTEKLTTDASDYTAWQGGDIVVYENHIGIVSDKRNNKGISYIIHHDGYHNYEEDGLTRKKIVGHYRFNLNLEEN